MLPDGEMLVLPSHVPWFVSPDVTITASVMESTSCSLLHHQQSAACKTKLTPQVPVSLHEYIPVGTLVLDQPTAQDWTPITICNLEELDKLQPSFIFLIKANWVKASVRELAENCFSSVLRLYVLPDDVGRSAIDRGDQGMQRRLQYLMSSVDRSRKAWDGQVNLSEPVDRYKTWSEEDESLFYLFNTVPSPDPTSLIVDSAPSQAAIDSLLNPKSLPHLKTHLHPYQARSAASMIRREVNPRRTSDPRVVETRGPLGDLFYFDCQMGQIFRHLKEYDEIKGGVLAESMGLGKTLISLATVLATKGHWPQIPPEYSLGLHPVRPSTGSLIDMAAATIGRQQIPWRNLFQKLGRSGESHASCIRALENNIGSYLIPPPPKRHSRRPSTIPSPERICLCPATIVILPQNLLHQWQHEISRHFSPHTFKILCLDTRERVVTPEVPELLKFDIIFFTRQRFEQEMFPSVAMNESRPCWCPRGSDCRCWARANYKSPLASMHFLRVIMDEGHDFAGARRNNVYYALSRLRVDRKWILSGTPASGLLGVEVNTAAFGAKGSNLSHSQMLEARKDDSLFMQECKDLESLGNMVTLFLDVKPWSNPKHEDHAHWGQYISPYPDGRRKPGSLANLMSSLFLRHRIQDIEAEIQLPALHNDIVYLNPSWQDRLTQNAFIAVLNVNAVTSERVDEDYMFHPANRQILNRLINNLRQSGFYWTSQSVEDLSKTLDVATRYHADHESQETGTPAADLALLGQTIESLRTILSSPSWVAFSIFHEMGIYVDGFPPDCLATFSVANLKDHDKTLLTGLTQVIEAQKWVDCHLPEGDNISSGLKSLGTRLMNRARNEAGNLPTETAAFEHEAPSVESTKTGQRKGTRKARSTIKDRQPKLTERLTVSKPRNMFKSKSEARLSTGKARAPVPSMESHSNLKSALKPTRSTAPFDPGSPLIKSKLMGTASAKLTYLLDRIMGLHEEEKILVFYEGDHIAYYIAQALDLVNVRYLIYTRSLDLALKSAYIATFQSTEKFRVLLMNIQEAAHGLHIASASRVFFVNPVWQPNVEAQAIKRAHRIGQTRPVYVETLVLKDVSDP